MFKFRGKLTDGTPVSGTSGSSDITGAMREFLSAVTDAKVVGQVERVTFRAIETKTRFKIGTTPDAAPAKRTKKASK
jgi:hypothetical protein